MFKKVKYKNRIILFISSYFPLYLIIFVQNFSSLHSKAMKILDNNNVKINQLIKSSTLVKLSLKKLLTFSETYVIIASIILIISSYFLVKRMVNDITQYADSAFKVKVLEAKNLNHEYVLTYFSIYIFPFITLNLSSFSGIIQFMILWFFIGYVYVKNNLVYTNPMLNMFFKYNIYLSEMEYRDDGDIYTIKSVLFTKKEKYEIEDRTINVLKESNDLYLEI